MLFDATLATTENIFTLETCNVFAFSTSLALLVKNIATIKSTITIKFHEYGPSMCHIYMVHHINYNHTILALAVAVAMTEKSEKGKPGLHCCH